jgi:hypothetical protein
MSAPAKPATPIIHSEVIGKLGKTQVITTMGGGLIYTEAFAKSGTCNTAGLWSSASPLPLYTKHCVLI